MWCRQSSANGIASPRPQSHPGSNRDTIADHWSDCDARKYSDAGRHQATDPVPYRRAATHSDPTSHSDSAPHSDLAPHRYPQADCNAGSGRL